jgi:peptidoglycan L-alanyl-D-glutamate endopeptidase CwlK
MIKPYTGSNMPKLSSKSRILLNQCDVRLQEVCEIAVEIMDFTIITGYRDKAAQAKAFSEGNSKLKYPESKHNNYPSEAVDIAPYPIDWNDRSRFDLLAGIMLGIAHLHGINLRWGGDWDGTFNPKANKFADLGHFEIKE